jgi:DNA mismatch repair protein MutS
MTKLTPMLKQFIGVKGEYPDAILFFRMGDFYEMFFEDARTASRILGITLTSRGTLNGEKVPMCGIPHHSSRSYIGKLVKSGLKVAVCEQVEDPKQSQGIVKREVVRLVTPGSIVDEGDLDEKSNLYIAAIYSGHPNDFLKSNAEKYGLAHVDLTTGEFSVTELNSINELLDELGRVEPAELLTFENSNLAGKKEFSNYYQETLKKKIFSPNDAEGLLRDLFEVSSLDDFGCGDMPIGIIAAGMLVTYLQETQKRFPGHIKEIISYRVGDFMALDETTCAHLELLKTMRRQSRAGSLFQILDKTMTPMGGRILKKWIRYPLINIEQVQKRLRGVSFLKDDPMLRQSIRDNLKDIYDLERLNGRVALGRVNARDLLALKSSIFKLPLIKEMLKDSISDWLSDIADRIDSLDDIGCLIDDAIFDDPPVSLKEGRMIREGYDDKLDKLISLSRDGKSWITEFVVSEQKRTGIASLKVGFNKIYGYYIEVSKANAHLTPSDYIRKQTLVNGERYITESLKNMEEMLLGSEEKRIALEFEIFERIRKKISDANQRIKATAEFIAKIDVVTGLAEAAEANDYVCPQINNSRDLHIVDGRHPVIEKTVKDETFVPNDIQMDSRDQQVLIITGPNMAGKSTILRQTALIVLMTQMGSFVPAAKAVIGLTDRIFTRVGAMDDLAKGQSTFMVEMKETANILRHATPRSLTILDEIGRGTSTYDGLSLAWAIAEALHDLEGKGVRTLFATHYHELTEMGVTKQRVKNLNIAVREWNDRIVFLRKLVPGATSRSYGIQVARIAGLPEPVLKRAEEVLDNLEGVALDETVRPRLSNALSLMKDKNRVVQLGLFETADPSLRDWIRGLDIHSMTPLDALLEINKLKEYVDSDR